ncbi:hypothetical protein RFI_29440 [Reticulomyxa filosa]|uniref:NACHT domain-containing protein n=1 Tax=Reticulomyxa filosa TaxID=46433 RepID=X6M4I8_RETFI|nr:hypothetical protein RFI_29440 [Reticulomyxa filosa]|eukprot:ETO07950.1 hypothetical protein RFI_29440 [Reticulomyxa filosa]
MFEKLKNRDNDKTKKQWLEIMKKLNIPQWNTDDTKCIMNTNSGLLLVLDGFDEIANLTQYVAIFCKLLHIKIFSVFVKVTLLQKKKDFMIIIISFNKTFTNGSFVFMCRILSLPK